jgi:3-hydroxy-9,10-secoandrosta-1,3,5(10)-triene-9,17-dione monooxygenase
MSAPTGEELVARARALAPRLEARRDEAAALRRLPDATVAEMQEAGLFRVLQPKRWQGCELAPQVFFDIQTILAAACPSTGWVYGVVAVHAWQLALFDNRAQAEVWGDDPSTLVSSSYMPVGKVTRVDGGLRLSGRWSFSSGSDHCKWAFLGAFVPNEGGPPDMRTFLVPRSDYTIEDVWRTSALQGTGSQDIVVDGAFVPEYRTHSFRDGFLCKSPGNAVNPSPLYRIPFGQIFVRSVSTSSIGMLQGALDAYLEVARKRVGSSDGAKVTENVRSQEAAARASATLDEAKLVLQRNMAALMEHAEAGRKIPVEERVRYRYHSSRVVHRCKEAIDELHMASGGRAIFLDNPINRYFNDVHAATAHFANNPDKPSRNLGRVLLGLKNTDFFL